MAALALTAATAAEGSQVRPLNIEQLTARAATIVSGRCTAVRAASAHASGHAIVETTVAVERRVKGGADSTLVVRTIDLAAGASLCRSGEDVVLFLYGASRSELTSAVGLGQGVFRLIRDKHDRPLAVGTVQHPALLRGLSERATSAIGATVGRWSPERGIPADELLDVVERLAAIEGRP